MLLARKTGNYHELQLRYYYSDLELYLWCKCYSLVPRLASLFSGYAKAAKKAGKPGDYKCYTLVIDLRIFVGSILPAIHRTIHGASFPTVEAPTQFPALRKRLWV